LPQYHEELVVRTESLTNLGFGIARVDLGNTSIDGGTAVEYVEEGEGGGGGTAPKEGKKVWVVFCPNVIPGELVRVRLYRNFASYSDADLLHVIEPSADRIEPACPLATVCGGCQYQLITIGGQRNMKTAQVQELFEQLGGLSPADFPPVIGTIGTDEVFGYRSKITPHYDAPVQKRALKRARGNGDAAMTSNVACEIGPIGFKEEASCRLVDVPYCHITTPAINDALRRAR
jgi:tRNA/tmRNA/rRNA uracil-C5-methylase (TrmA/RlmC/RlmD family)